MSTNSGRNSVSKIEKSTWAERLQSGFSLLIVLASVLYLSSPSEPLRPFWVSIVEARDIQETLEKNWSQLISVAASLTDSDAEMQVIEFSDYQCPFCRQTHEELTTYFGEQS